ncbi:MAG: PKD domain-containing protein [Candidatus Parcubacteria bacterium]|nr:PKD domain-containing protein [Candidatus Parcubacteria bacterium]
MKRMAAVLAVLVMVGALCSCERFFNQAPVAMVNCDPVGIVAAPMQFSPEGSYDPDGAIVRYTWNFCDGSSLVSETAEPVEHRYAEPGIYNGYLTVQDEAGVTATCSFEVTVKWEPCILGESDGPADVSMYITDTQGGIVAFLGGPSLFTVALGSEYDLQVVARDGVSPRGLGETDGIAWVQVMMRKPNGDITTYDTRKGSLDLAAPQLKDVKFDQLGKWTMTIYTRDNDECSEQVVFTQDFQVGVCPQCNN